jgi:hypothetical protein
MGCNCGKTKTAAREFLYTPPSGPTKTYRTEIEAKAAVIRNGGTYKPK